MRASSSSMPHCRGSRSNQSDSRVGGWRYCRPVVTSELDRAPRVLVVDDDPVVRQSVGLLVRAAGATVVADAVDGSDAVARAREHRPDVVLMDVRMPGVGGPEATEEILRSLPETRIIAMTTLGTEDALTRMLGAGALGFLTKDDIF